MLSAVERAGAAAGSTPARRPMPSPITPLETRLHCQKVRVCRKPFLCSAERDCYFVATVERYYAEALLAAYPEAA